MMMILLVCLTHATMGQPAATTDGPAKPVAVPASNSEAAAAYNSARTAVDALMRSKGLVLEDAPAGVRAQADKIKTTIAAGDYARAVADLSVISTWVETTVVDLAFVQGKFGNATQLARRYLAAGNLDETQTRETYARLDKAAESLNAERVAETNLILNDLLALLRTLPQPLSRPEPVSP